jgi:hypothetical protein
MLLRHAFLQRSIQKHLGLLTIISAHIFKANPNFKKSHGGESFFNSLLDPEGLIMAAYRR